MKAALEDNVDEIDHLKDERLDGVDVRWWRDYDGTS
jgi:hypothetical protein